MLEQKKAIDVVKNLLDKLDDEEERWSIVVLDRGWIFVGKLSYDERGHGVLKNAANIRRWGTTKGLPQLQSGPTDKTVIDPCSMTVRFASSILILDASEKGWADAF